MSASSSSMQRKDVTAAAAAVSEDVAEHAAGVLLASTFGDAMVGRWRRLSSSRLTHDLKGTWSQKNYPNDQNLLLKTPFKCYSCHYTGACVVRSVESTAVAGAGTATSSMPTDPAAVPPEVASLAAKFCALCKECGDERVLAAAAAAFPKVVRGLLGPPPPPYVVGGDFVHANVFFSPY